MIYHWLRSCSSVLLGVCALFFSMRFLFIAPSASAYRLAQAFMGSDADGERSVHFMNVICHIRLGSDHRLLGGLGLNYSARVPVWLHARTGRFLLVLAAILWTSLVGDGAARSGLQLDMLRSVVDVHRRIASTR